MAAEVKASGAASSNTAAAARTANSKPLPERRAIIASAWEAGTGLNKNK
eukprot:CAMPEP_0183517252 /NCGR_PEP_ID=MMETSP0371-20130417/14745_1 /TAXON_ID=268820 /ORGANISM="Peridinium aciculiferum, Strain PAER-2" /LENGTH=48 /DNA_ID= /DNA_START= /DNA_END= /DNA_ORIENTATION=